MLVPLASKKLAPPLSAQLVMLLTAALVSGMYEKYEYLLFPYVVKLLKTSRCTSYRFRSPRSSLLLLSISSKRPLDLVQQILVDAVILPQLEHLERVADAQNLQQVPRPAVCDPVVSQVDEPQALVVDQRRRELGCPPRPTRS